MLVRQRAPALFIACRQSFLCGDREHLAGGVDIIGPLRPEGRIYSWERVWHAVHPALKTAVRCLVVLVELSEPTTVRLIGNLLGDPHQRISIGAEVAGEFEHHTASEPPFSLLQWRVL
jgi:hypothetical protein